MTLIDRKIRRRQISMYSGESPRICWLLLLRSTRIKFPIRNTGLGPDKSGVPVNPHLKFAWIWQKRDGLRCPSFYIFQTISWNSSRINLCQRNCSNKGNTSRVLVHSSFSSSFFISVHYCVFTLDSEDEDEWTPKRGNSNPRLKREPTTPSTIFNLKFRYFFNST